MQEYNGFYIDDILNCGTNDFGSGLKAMLFFVPIDYVALTNIPSTSNFQESLLISSTDIVLKSDKKWNCIQLLLDENELKTGLEGSSRRKKSVVSIRAFVLGLRAKVLGFIELMKNENMLCVVLSGDGHPMLVGTLKNPARLNLADGTTAKSYTDNPGVAVEINAKAPVLFYKEKIEITTSGSGPVPSFFKNDYGFIDLS